MNPLLERGSLEIEAKELCMSADDLAEIEEIREDAFREWIKSHPNAEKAVAKKKRP